MTPYKETKEAEWAKDVVKAIHLKCEEILGVNYDEKGKTHNVEKLAKLHEAIMSETSSGIARARATIEQGGENIVELQSALMLALLGEKKGEILGTYVTNIAANKNEMPKQLKAGLSKLSETRQEELRAQAARYGKIHDQRMQEGVPEGETKKMVELKELRSSVISSTTSQSVAERKAKPEDPVMRNSGMSAGNKEKAAAAAETVIAERKTSIRP